MNTENEIPLRRFKTLLVVDLEATCWGDALHPREDMETIEFGGVLVRMEDLKPIDQRSWFVKPKLHRISEFCTQLTSITQADVDGGIHFEDLVGLVRDWLAPHRERLGWGSWGGYDRRQLEMDAERLGIAAPLSGVPHVNLKNRFAERHQITGRRPGKRRALGLCGLTINGTHHRGIDDARNTARLLPWLLDPKLKIHGAAQRQRNAKARVIAAAAVIMGGSKQAASWYRTPLADFAGRTAEALVAEGRAEDVVRYIESLGGGESGT